MGAERMRWEHVEWDGSRINGGWELMEWDRSRWSGMGVDEIKGE
jgi:hypothetical protein